MTSTHRLYQAAQEMVERFDSNPIYATKRARENAIVAALESVEEHEREACAKIAEDHLRWVHQDACYEEIAAAIRARKDA